MPEKIKVDEGDVGDIDGAMRKAGCFRVCPKIARRKTALAIIKAGYIRKDSIELDVTKVQRIIREYSTTKKIYFYAAQALADNVKDIVK